jgi:hypothetical protein
MKTWLNSANVMAPRVQYMMHSILVQFVLIMMLCIIETTNGASFPCSSISFVDPTNSLPPVPGFPSTLFSETISLSELVQAHYSEKAVMARPDIITSLDGTQTSCPHLGQSKGKIGREYSQY